MVRFRRLLLDRRGRMVEKVAVAAGLIAIAGMGGAHYLDVATHDGGLQRFAALFRAGRAGIDYTATASIRTPAGQTVLDPCTGKAK